ncbi:six-bladed beta-propeller -like protein [Stemphylium lycopersici]|uniref:Six-bladed beta-propeller-like protein n=1 Tax=Stemphylium lycopersici TaxID=183478 RepID=A0A364N715_STELY|nr:six-bladed beta-propeller -like protein [Stemphylium lycopersici]RAR03578.1 six-bladed beta-propeller -like protein [Stemphylium lycopersici]RAR12923.1 six-bladed beta-propeller -like protein [Stemphylium lycopersici]
MLRLSVVFTFLVISILRAPFVATASLPFASQGSAHTVFQFDNGTWLENIAVRSNGNLLVTLIDRPELYQIDPFHNTATLVTNLEDEADALSLLGITEMAPDVFVFIAGNFSIARAASDPASYSIWQVDFNRGGKCEKVSVIEKLPEASFLNGMTALNRQEGTVLISDSVRGLVWRLNVWTGKYEVVLQDETMVPAEGTRLVLGINGIRIFNGYLYYVNALRGLFCRVPIDLYTGKASGPYEVLETDLPGDDFAMSADGVAYVTENGGNSLERVGADGSRSLIAGGLNSTTVAGATSAAFGRKWWDRGVVYVTTSGGQAAPVNGTYTEGGKVVAILV